MVCDAIEYTESQCFWCYDSGALAVISGFNQHIAWGETNATRDVIDWYKVEFNEDRTQYKYDEGWKDVSMRIEDIHIKGQKAYKDTVLYTHHGPVVFDKNFKSDNERAGYAMMDWSRGGKPTKNLSSAQQSKKL